MFLLGFIRPPVFFPCSSRKGARGEGEEGGRRALFARRWVGDIMSRGFMSALGMYFSWVGVFSFLSFYILSEGAGLGVLFRTVVLVW